MVRVQAMDPNYFRTKIGIIAVAGVCITPAAGATALKQNGQIVAPQADGKFAPSAQRRQQEAREFSRSKGNSSDTLQPGPSLHPKSASRNNDPIGRIVAAHTKRP